MNLTKAEEEVMQVIWKLGPCIVSDMLKEFGEPTPPHSTISSIVRILEKKGFVSHKAYGRTHEYYALISREEYGKRNIRRMLSSYFDGSVKQLVSFLVKEEDVDPEEIQALIDQIEKKKTAK